MNWFWLGRPPSRRGVTYALLFSLKIHKSKQKNMLPLKQAPRKEKKEFS